MAEKHPPGNECSFETGRNLIGEILRDYRVQLGETWEPVPLGEFAALLSLPLQSQGRTITPEEVSAWEQGRCPPPDDLVNLIRLLARPNSWQWRLAGDLRAVKKPQVFRASSPIVRALLGQERRPSRRVPVPGGFPRPPCRRRRGHSPGSPR